MVAVQLEWASGLFFSKTQCPVGQFWLHSGSALRRVGISDAGFGLAPVFAGRRAKHFDLRCHRAFDSLGRALKAERTAGRNHGVAGKAWS